MDRGVADCADCPAVLLAPTDRNAMTTDGMSRNRARMTAPIQATVYQHTSAGPVEATACRGRSRLSVSPGCQNHACTWMPHEASGQVSPGMQRAAWRVAVRFALLGATALLAATPW